ncbi:fungal-specific transcription factor domain-containing protein [Apiospora phragmitis]|uniref:Fungal-specific transcription factor domain-containing protein n=1 Tax=Apiospora phragmitis TaxID=2905665 RepID=A0ABR1WTK8_9PEZI
MATLDGVHRRVEKRNRPPVSCEPCRTRKQKCNRSLPCDTCIKRGKSTACVYAPNASRARPELNKSRDMKDRLNNLERLVYSFLAGEAPAKTSPSIADGNNSTDSEDTSTLINTPPSLSRPNGDAPLSPETPNLQHTGDGQVNYIDPSHWLSILDDIKEVREHLSVPNQTMAQSAMAFDTNRLSPEAGFLPMPTQTFSLSDAVSALPAQSTCDRLISWYFNARFMVLGVVHPAKFQVEYTAFWESPSAASPLWVALLFSILSIAAGLRLVTNIIEPAGSVPPISKLQQITVKCLVLGRYTTANAYALEAFVLHLQSGWFSLDTSPVDLWFEMGTVIRLALRMGYHRDPSKLAGISPYDGEMRRRVWLNIVQVDALMSYQNGYPSMVPSEYCDTDVPRNLEDSDLRVDMAALPPSRPLNEQTPVLYVIVKAGVMAVFKRIVAHTQSISVKPYAHTLLLDNEMNQAYNAVPYLLRQRDIKQSFLDHAVLIWQRCTIELLYLKGLIILHRRYINYDQQSPDFEPSRRACVQAALDILARQAEVHEACAPGGRLYEDQWIFAALSAHDFLLAAMVVSLDLSVRMRSSGQHLPSSETEYQQLAGKEYRALRISERIWAASSAISPEANIAALALDLMIKKVAEKDTGLFFPHDTGLEQMEFTSDSELPYAGVVCQMIDGSEIIDWGLLDQYFQNMDPSTMDVTF